MHALETVVDAQLSDAEAALREALAQEGFGILTEIDVAATLEAKLGVHRRPLKILGACSPSLAHQALELDPSLALLLPCNVVLEEAGERRTHVAIADPQALLHAGGNGDDRLTALGAEATASLARALARLE